MRPDLLGEPMMPEDKNYVEMDEVKKSYLINIKEPERVREEVCTIVSLMFQDFNFKSFNKVFQDVRMLFDGSYPGYQASNAPYHDLCHTTDALLAMARLIHGAFTQEKRLSRENINLALITALFHDTGYIQKEQDTNGTGAKYTFTHVQRSIEFMDRYFTDNDFSRDDYENGLDIILCTGLTTNISQIQFRSDEFELLGKMMGTADLIGQMADRDYLEKLLFLYHEFKEGNIGDYSSEIDLLKKTIGFYDLTSARLANDLGGVGRYMIHHFRERWNIDQDLYDWYIDKNLNYLKQILHTHEHEHREQLRRGGVVKKLEEDGL
jgi:hypothetical protein